MLFALDPVGGRVTATPGARGSCPQCRAALVPKCGEIVAHHWAHRNAADCDPWAEPESAWHLGWKARLAAAGAAVEVTRRVGDEWHRADAVIGGRTVELQHSSLSIGDGRQREQFYGDGMIWLWDMTGEVWERVHFGRVGFWWKHGSLMQTQLRRPVWWHTPDDQVTRVRIGVDVSRDGMSRRVVGKMLYTGTADRFVNWLGEDRSIV